MNFDLLPWPYSFLATLINQNLLNLNLADITNVSYEVTPRAANTSAPPDVAVFNRSGTESEEPGVVVIHWGPAFVSFSLLACGLTIIPLLRYASDVHTTFLTITPNGSEKEKPIDFPKRTSLLRGFIPATILGITRTVLKTLVTGFLAFFLPDIVCGYLGRIVAYTIFARWAMVVTHIQISKPTPIIESQRWVYRTWPVRVLSTPWLLTLPTLGPLALLAVIEGIVVTPSIIAELLRIPAELYLVRAQAAVLPSSYDSLVPVDTGMTRVKAKKIARWVLVQKVAEVVVGVMFILSVNVVIAVMTGRFWILVDKIGYFPGMGEREL